MAHSSSRVITFPCQTLVHKVSTWNAASPTCLQESCSQVTSRQASLIAAQPPPFPLLAGHPLSNKHHHGFPWHHYILSTTRNFNLPPPSNRSNHCIASKEVQPGNPPLVHLPPEVLSHARNWSATTHQRRVHSKYVCESIRKKFLYYVVTVPDFSCR